MTDPCGTRVQGRPAVRLGVDRDRRPHHFLLLRKHLQTGEIAYHYCHVPPDRSIPLMTLVRVACLRWPVEEDFEFGKDHFGLDH